MADLIIRQQAPLNDVVFLTLEEKGFGAYGVVLSGPGSFAGFGSADEVAVHVALAEPRKWDLLVYRPAGQAADLNCIVTLSFFRTGGLEVEEELVECFLPGKGRDS